LLNQLNIGPNRHKITKLAIVLAMERHNPQRELISRLISDLYSSLLTQDDIARGFDELLVSLDDIRLDTPDAHTVSTLLSSYLFLCSFTLVLFLHLFLAILSHCLLPQGERYQPEVLLNSNLSHFYLNPVGLDVVQLP